MIEGDSSFLSFLDEEYMPPEDQLDSFEITHDNLADWAVMKIKAAQALVAAKTQERAKAIAKWDAYVERETRQALHDTAFFEGKLHGYLLCLLESGKLGRKKSWNLPNGTLQLRTLPATYKIVDEDAFRAWCAQHDLVAVIVKPKWSEAKQRFVAEASGDQAVIDTQTGEYIPGIEVSHQPIETFSVRLSAEEESAS